MASKVISALADGSPVVDTDEFIIARAAGNNKATAAELRTYMALGMPVVLGCKAAGWSHTGDTTDTVLTRVAIAAGVLNVNSVLVIDTLWSYTNNSNNKSVRVRFGTAGTNADTAFLSSGKTTTASSTIETRIYMRGSSSQIGFAADNPGGTSDTASANKTGAIDITQATYITFTGQLANTADTVKLEAYNVRLLPAV
jgi:hypothetical protein